MTSRIVRPTVVLAATLAACSGHRPALRAAVRSARVAAPVAALLVGPGTVHGKLARGRSLLGEDGRLSQTYLLDLESGHRQRFQMRSTELDAELVLNGPEGFHALNDDAFPGSTDALLDVMPAVGGRYTLQATTASSGQSGNYTLQMERRPDAGEGSLLAPGATQAVLGEVTDTRDLPGTWFHFEARPGARVRLRVTSRDFDTVATVLGPRGEAWVNDDANDLGPDHSERPLDSTVDVAIPEAGTYHLVVTSYANHGGGAFRVVQTERPPVVLREGDVAPVEGYAGPDARGRLLGLYAGITAYEGGRLYGCADDARFLGDALRGGHLQAPADQEVLVDHAATRAAFLAGIHRLAVRARPDDVVLVFFSGHGNVQPAPEGDHTELDGIDETIQLVDGALTDTEVAAALGEIHAATVILALDSCHSGGFADDWVTAPGRIGLFSSDPDVLSDTAEPRRAGGYLSYYLRRGVLGEADARPRDGVLQAGELTDYLYAGFVTDHARMNPPGSNNPYQRLDVARGSVPWTQALWVYPRRPADLALPPVPELPLASPAP